MSTAVAERRSSRRIRLRESSTTAVLTQLSGSLDVSVLDFSAGGFLVETSDSLANLDDKGILSIWGQHIHVQKRHEQRTDSKRRIGFQRTDSAVTPASRSPQGNDQAGVRWRRSRPERGWTWAIGVIVGGLIVVAIACFAALLTNRGPAGNQRSTNIFFQQLSEKSQLATAASSSADKDAGHSAVPVMTHENSRIAFFPALGECRLDLRNVTAAQAKAELRNCLKLYQAATYRVFLDFGSKSSKQPWVELHCGSGAIRQLITILSTHPNGWAQLQQAVANFVAQCPWDQRDQPAGNMEWDDLRFRWGNQRHIHVEALGTGRQHRV